MSQRGLPSLIHEQGGKPKNMCEALDRIEAKGRREGEIIGMKKGEMVGEKKGEKKVADLIQKLIAANRNDEIGKAVSNTRYRNKLYKEFQIS